MALGRLPEAFSMTSPITPESRAKEFANWMSHHILGGMAAKDETCGACIAHAASVIRDTENDALEVACAAASGAVLRAFDTGCDRVLTAIAVVDAIRSLKTRKPQE